LFLATVHSFSNIVSLLTFA